MQNIAASRTMHARQSVANTGSMVQITASRSLAYREYVKCHERSPPARPSPKHKPSVGSAHFKQVTTVGTVRNEAALCSRTVKVSLDDILVTDDGWPLRFRRGRSRGSTCSAQASLGKATAVSLQPSVLCVRPPSVVQLPVCACSNIFRSASTYVQS